MVMISRSQQLNSIRDGSRFDPGRDYFFVFIFYFPNYKRPETRLFQQCTAPYAISEPQQAEVNGHCRFVCYSRSGYDCLYGTLLPHQSQNGSGHTQKSIAAVNSYRALSSSKESDGAGVPDDRLRDSDSGIWGRLATHLYIAT